MRILPLALVPFLLAAACKDGRVNDRATTPSPAPERTAQPEAPATAETMSVEQARAALPGFPVDRLPDWLRGELVEVARDEFVFDGSPYTLAGCLTQDMPCKQNAIRGLTLIATLMQEGATRSEALSQYNRYYESFDAKNRASIDLQDVACMGPADAKVTLVEYSDFECPYCAAARPMFENAAKQPNVRLCFKHFPLPGHPNAFPAAQTAVFAHQHGKFWQVHDLIFANQRRLSPQLLRDLVRQVGLDPAVMAKGVESGELAAVVEKHRAEGEKIGVQGTPTLFVNGRRMQLPLKPELLRFTIEDELKWQAHGGKWAER